MVEFKKTKELLKELKHRYELKESEKIIEILSHYEKQYYNATHNRTAHDS